MTAVRISEKSQQNLEINSHKSGNLVKILNIFEKYLKMVFIIFYKYIYIYTKYTNCVLIFRM